jgi:AcrR family transcriptional regulator
MSQQTGTDTRVPLSKERILETAVALADEAGIEAVSMRKLAERLDVVPMALYKHVANKEDLLDGMVDLIVEEIEPPTDDTDWKRALRRRILSARDSLLRHPWASDVIESRTTPTPAVLDYMNSIAGTFRTGGFSPELTHQVMHTLGSRMWGFTRELFPSPPPADPQVQEAMIAHLAARYPHIVEVATAADHAGDGIVGAGCDDQYEFEFALDVLLDGFERLHEQSTSKIRPAQGE